MFLLIFGLALAIWGIIFIMRLITSGLPLPYLCYLLASSVYILMYLDNPSTNDDNSGLLLFLLFGFLATMLLLGVILSSWLGEGVLIQDIFAALEFRAGHFGSDKEIKTAGWVMIWMSAMLVIGIPWSFVLGLW